METNSVMYISLMLSLVTCCSCIEPHKFMGVYWRPTYNKCWVCVALIMISKLTLILYFYRCLQAAPQQKSHYPTCNYNEDTEDVMGGWGSDSNFIFIDMVQNHFGILTWLQILLYTIIWRGKHYKTYYSYYMEEHWIL